MIGIIVYIPNICHRKKTRDHQPITLLNGDCMVLARAIAKRLPPDLTRIMRQEQINSTPGCTALDSVATVKDAIAYGDLMERAGCI
jgi:hypothetical protein